MKAFLRWACELDYVKKVPKFTMQRETRHSRPQYTDQELERMHAACERANLTLPTPAEIGDCPPSLWWQTLIVLLWESATRISEMMSMEWDWLESGWADMDACCLTNDPACTKTNRESERFIGPRAIAHLRALAEYGTDGKVFQWRRHRSRLNKGLAKIQDAAGMDATRAQLKWHAFRRSSLDRTAELYGLAAAQRVAGHASSGMTRRYAHIAERKRARLELLPIPGHLVPSTMKLRIAGQVNVAVG